MTATKRFLMVIGVLATVGLMCGVARVKNEYKAQKVVRKDGTQVTMVIPMNTQVHIIGTADEHNVITGHLGNDYISIQGNFTISEPDALNSLDGHPYVFRDTGFVTLSGGVVKTPVIKCQVSNGKLDGDYFKYSPSGTLAEYSLYDNGVKVSSTVYDANGTLVLMEQ